MKNKTIFSFIKNINENFYDKLITNLSRDIYLKEKELKDVVGTTPFAQNTLYQDVLNKLYLFVYEDLKNENYDNLKKFNHDNNIVWSEIYKIALNKLDFKLIHDIVTNKNNISNGYLINGFNASLYPTINFSKDITKKYTRTITNNSTADQMLFTNVMEIAKTEEERENFKKNYIKEIFYSLDTILEYEKYYQLEILEMLTSNLNKNLIVKKEDINKYLLTNNFDKNPIFHNNLLIDILNYSTLNSYERYSVIKECSKNIKTQDYTNNNLIEEIKKYEEYGLKIDNKYLSLKNYNLNINNMSDKKIEILKDLIITISITKDIDIKEDMLNKLNDKLETNLRLDHITSEFYQFQKSELKDLTKEEFDKIEQEYKEQQLEKFNTNLKEI